MCSVGGSDCHVTGTTAAPLRESNFEGFVRFKLLYILKTIARGVSVGSELI